MDPITDAPTPAPRTDPWTQPYGHALAFPRYAPEEYDVLGPRQPLLAGLLPRPGVTLLAGAPKTGKSTFATALAWSVATGTPFAGVPVERGTAVYIDYEASLSERRAELARLPVEDHPDHEFRYGLHTPSIDDPDFLPVVQWLVQDARPRLIVVDSIRGGLDRLSPDNPNRARRLARLFQDLAGYSCNPERPGGPPLPGTTILLIHHADARGTRPADSAQLAAGVGATLLLRNEPHPADERARILNLTLSGRNAEVGPSGARTLRLATDGPLSYRLLDLELPPIEPDLDATLDATEADLLAALAPIADREPPTSQDLALLTNRNIGTVRNALTRLIRERRVLATSHGRTSRYTLTNRKIGYKS